MPKESAGLVLYRVTTQGIQVLLVHPGGPFWARKDAGAWSIPKGELGTGEEPLSAALRELKEETGFVVEGPFHDLGSIRQSGGKTVRAFAAAAEVDPAALRSNGFQMEWPPHSGQTRDFPEVDRAAWFSLGEAEGKIIPSQREFLRRLPSVVVR